MFYNISIFYILKSYQKCFAGSFANYTSLENERLFIVIPTLIERWLYINRVPYMQVIDIQNRTSYTKQYLGS